MENKKSKVEDLAKFAKDGKIIIEHRRGMAEKFLDPVGPVLPTSINITGRIGTIAEFLSKRAHQFKNDGCNILVDLNENVMMFTGNERTEDNKFETCVSSNIIETEKYKGLLINSDHEFEALELARFLRKRKNMFVDAEQFNNVWAALSSFKAEIQKQIEKADSRDGNAVNSIRQTVTHNMPRYFELLVPIFEGVSPVKIEIEVDVNPNSLACSLMSFDLEQKYEDLRENLFEDELDQVIDDKLKLRDYCVVYYG